MTTTRGELTDAERVARLEEEVQHLVGELDRARHELEAMRSHEIERERIRTLDEHRGAIPRFAHRQVW